MKTTELQRLKDMLYVTERELEECHLMRTERELLAERAEQLTKEIHDLDRN